MHAFMHAFVYTRMSLQRAPAMAPATLMTSCLNDSKCVVEAEDTE